MTLKGSIPWNKGKTNVYSAETLKRKSISATGHKHTEETKRKLSEFQKGKPSWNKGKGWSKEVKEKFRLAKLGKRLTEEHKKKISVKLKGKNNWSGGENNWHWQGGISYSGYSVEWNNTLKRSIRERDHYTCKVCSSQQGDVAFSVHHIDYNKKNCNPDNLITLCNSCHIKTNGHREYWKNYFSWERYLAKQADMTK